VLATLEEIPKTIEREKVMLVEAYAGRQKTEKEKFGFGQGCDNNGKIEDGNISFITKANDITGDEY